MPRARGRRGRSGRGNTGVGRGRVSPRVVSPGRAASERPSHVESNQRSHSSRTALPSPGRESPHASTITSDRRSLHTVSRASVSPTNRSNLNDAATVSSAATSNVASRKAELETRASIKRFEIQNRLLEERARIETELIEEQLRIDLDACGERDEDLRSVISRRSALREQGSPRGSREIQQWINNGYREQGRYTGTTTPINPIELSRSEKTDMRAHDKVDSIRSHLIEHPEPPLQDEQKLTRRLIQRVAIGKGLPTFEGDVLEWPFYKRAFEETSKKGEYSEEENIL